ncbi:MAG: 16S rRNA (cytosine(967)-C(5))-methyltransferase RsmB, partial [Gemmatimonadetes bacterium]|nr:16S rRNA (cytosine(967)-C(5))-methyltransferase RsmB [Gemmatimonadota bacterium]
MRPPDPARLAATRLLRDLERQAQPFDELLQALDESLPTNRDARFARQLVLGAVRWQKRLDWIIATCCARPVVQLSPWARHILRLGTYQLFWLDRVPQSAAVHTSVELAKHLTHQGIASLVNAVLRNLLRQRARISYPDQQQTPTRYLAVYHSHPEWLVDRWVGRWGRELVEHLLAANNEPAALNIYLNPLRAGRETVAELDLVPVGSRPGFYRAANGADLFASHAYQQGQFQVQDPNAGLAVALLDPQPGECLLDLCSAPGGKAVQAAIAMADRGWIVAADISLPRLNRVRENARRLRLRAIRPVVRDGTTPGCGAFDRVLADVPCSATGVLGRRPDARWRRNPAEFAALTKRQQVLIRRAYEHVRPGGVLVYSTCSLEEEENEAIVERFLKQTPTPARSRASSLASSRPATT